MVEYRPMNEKDSKVGVYEVSTLFVPELEAQELSQTIDSLKSYLSELGAEIISEGAPVHIKLAYTVEKHINNKIRRSDFAHFYWVKFATDPANIAKVNAYFDTTLNEKSLRHLLIKTVRENTVLTELTEAKLADIKNEELIEEVLGSDVKEEEVSENTITDLGGDVPLVKEEEK